LNVGRAGLLPLRAARPRAPHHDAGTGEAGPKAVVVPEQRAAGALGGLR